MYFGLTIIVIRLMAAFWFLQGVWAITTLLAADYSEYQEGAWVYSAVYAAMSLVGPALWILAPKIAKSSGARLTPDQAPPPASDVADLVNAGTFLIGLFYFVNNFAYGIQGLFGMWEQGAIWDNSLIPNVGMTTVALFLMIYSTHVFRWFLKLRRMGLGDKD